MSQVSPTTVFLDVLQVVQPESLRAVGQARVLYRGRASVPASSRAPGKVQEISTEPCQRPDHENTALPVVDEPATAVTAVQVPGDGKHRRMRAAPSARILPAHPCEAIQRAKEVLGATMPLSRAFELGREFERRKIEAELEAEHDSVESDHLDAVKRAFELGKRIEARRWERDFDGRVRDAIEDAMRDDLDQGDEPEVEVEVSSDLPTEAEIESVGDEVQAYVAGWTETRDRALTPDETVPGERPEDGPELKAWTSGAFEAYRLFWPDGEARDA